MDMTPAMNVFFKWIGYAVLIGLVGAIFRSAWFKGAAGEFIVNVAAKLFLSKEKYHLARNVTLPTEDGGTTQIDHVIEHGHRKRWKNKLI